MSIKNKINKNVSIAPYTTFKIGGLASFFVEVKNEEELEEALLYAKENNLEIFILGGGSNILVNDTGFAGLVIRMVNDEFSVEESIIKCGGGVQLSRLVSLATENGLTSLEWAAGIPGSVGGAIRGNAGAFGGEMANSVKEVIVFDRNSGKYEKYSQEQCNFSYRNSLFKEKGNLIIFSAILELSKGNDAEISNRIKENIGKRVSKQPQGASAGSFFENPVVTDQQLIARFEKDTALVSRGGKIPAGWLVAEVGLLGKKIGGAKVSEDHGNFVLNIGGATAQDVVILASFIKQQVRSKLGVQLKEEVQYVGF